MITKEIIERLVKLQTWDMSKRYFDEIFKRTGENPEHEHSLSSHLWRKYTDGGHNFLRFWGQLDSGNQNIILDELEST